MGGESSKRCSSLGSISYTSSGCVDFPNHFRKETDAIAWTLLHQCLLDKWKEGHAKAAGFNEVTLSCSGVMHKECSDSFCVSRQGIINMHKETSFFSFRKRSKFAKMADHFEYNHIPAQLSSVHHLRVLSVLCYREKLVVLHVSRAGRSQLGLLDLKANKFLGVFAELAPSFELSNRDVRASLSPDCSRLLVLVARPVRELQLYDTTRKMLVAQMGVSGLSHFYFDPRFNWTRAAITSYAEPNNLSIINLRDCKVVASNNRFSDDNLEPKDTRQVRYTPDGSLLIVSMVQSSCSCDGSIRRANIYVFCSTTAITLHCILYDRYTCAMLVYFFNNSFFVNF